MHLTCLVAMALMPVVSWAADDLTVNAPAMGGQPRTNPPTTVIVPSDAPSTPPTTVSTLSPSPATPSPTTTQPPLTTRSILTSAPPTTETITAIRPDPPTPVPTAAPEFDITAVHTSAPPTPPPTTSAPPEDTRVMPPPATTTPTPQATEPSQPPSIPNPATQPPPSSSPATTPPGDASPSPSPPAGNPTTTPPAGQRTPEPNPSGPQVRHHLFQGHRGSRDASTTSTTTLSTTFESSSRDGPEEVPLLDAAAANRNRPSSFSTRRNGDGASGQVMNDAMEPRSSGVNESDLDDDLIHEEERSSRTDSGDSRWNSKQDANTSKSANTKAASFTVLTILAVVVVASVITLLFTRFQARKNTHAFNNGGSDRLSLEVDSFTGGANDKATEPHFFAFFPLRASQLPPGEPSPQLDGSFRSVQSSRHGHALHSANMSECSDFTVSLSCMESANDLPVDSSIVEEELGKLSMDFSVSTLSSLTSDDYTMYSANSSRAFSECESMDQWSIGNSSFVVADDNSSVCSSQEHSESVV